jgi:hypothetical protein
VTEQDHRPLVKVRSEVWVSAIALIVVAAMAVLALAGSPQGAVAVGIGGFVAASILVVTSGDRRAVVAPGLTGDLTRTRRFLLVWIALTVLTGPVAYGAPLLLTVPVLAALLARLFVGPTHLVWAGPACAVLGPLMVIGAAWFGGRVDEVPSEGLPSGAMVLVPALVLAVMRHVSRRAIAQSA